MLLQITEFKAWRTPTLTTLEGNIASYLPPLFPFKIQCGYIGTAPHQLLILSKPPITPFTKFDIKLIGYEGLDRVFIEASVLNVTLDRKEINVAYAV